MEANQAIYDRDAEFYPGRALLPPERKAMELVGDRLQEIDMLDIGIGSGRTTHTFGPAVRRYVGIDYSPRMIERAKQTFGEASESIELVVADARDLSSLRARFDFVLFSFNGIDSVGHEDRLKVLAEVRQVLVSEGVFLFSTHSMNALPLTLPRSCLQDRPGRQVQRFGRRLERVNKDLDLAAAHARGWVIITDGAHNFELRLYYIDPIYQVSQLRDAGFETIAVFDKAGLEVDVRDAGRDPWLHYYCRPT